MRVLVVKMSSMGDIIHTLPALSDAADVIPSIQFDWVVEEAFTEIPTWHKSVIHVIPVALRRWRRQPWLALHRKEAWHFCQRLRAQCYDKVIDAQGSIKSAVVMRLSRGYRLGMDKDSVREIFADFAYQKKFFVPRTQHAVHRLRQLFAQALEYPLPDNAIRYNVAKNRFCSLRFNLPNDYLVVVPNASDPRKCYSEAFWAALLKKTAQAGIFVVVPWGSEEERKCAIRICGDGQHTAVLPRLRLGEIASLLLQAKAAVCVDTGLSHLAAALSIPAITLYGPTDPGLIGTLGPTQIHLRTIGDRIVSVETVWQALQQVLAV